MLWRATEVQAAEQSAHVKQGVGKGNNPPPKEQARKQHRQKSLPRDLLTDLAFKLRIDTAGAGAA